MMWGLHKENGIWRSAKSRRRLLWRGHDSLFIACGRWRVRLMKPWLHGKCALVPCSDRS